MHTTMVLGMVRALVREMTSGDTAGPSWYPLAVPEKAGFTV